MPLGTSCGGMRDLKHLEGGVHIGKYDGGAKACGVTEFTPPDTETRDLLLLQAFI